MSSIIDPSSFEDNEKGRLSAAQRLRLLPGILTSMLLLLASIGFASVPIRDFYKNNEAQ